MTDKKFSELEKLGITVYFLPDKGVHMILADDGIKAFKAGKNAVKRIVRKKDLDEVNIKLEKAGVKLLDDCR